MSSMPANEEQDHFQKSTMPDGIARHSPGRSAEHGTQDFLQASQPAPLRREVKSQNVEAAYVMATNNSSIVSKRAVEYTYYPEKAQYFQFFVDKQKTRAPLINRGYWLRMKCIENVLHRFLTDGKSKKKVVINLGAGYDPLAIRTLGQMQELPKDAVFVDVDHLELIKKKCDIIQAHERRLSFCVGGCDIKREENQPVQWRSKCYIAFGCDLNACSPLLEFLGKEFDSSKCDFLVISEVALCYVIAEKADQLIEQIAGIGDVTFCLLEQFLPHGSGHPFAETMLKHFRKVKSPLRSLEYYDTLQSQRDRFLKAKWTSVDIRSLWELWNDDDFIAREVKLSLNSVEPFDEWEDLALFASHYFLLLAKTRPEPGQPPQLLQVVPKPPPSSEAQPTPLNPHQELEESTEPDQNRRFGALYETRQGVFCYHGGYGDQKRVGTTLIFSSCKNRTKDVDSNLSEIEPRMCHTVTTLNGQMDCLLVGGRTSPVCALKSCWLRESGVWRRAEPLPVALYRHSATRVDLEIACTAETGVLVFGGRTNSERASSSWYLWRAGTGWLELACSPHSLGPRFSAAMATDHNGVSGVLVGGMNEVGAVIPEYYSWRLAFDGTQISVDLSAEQDFVSLVPGFCRFGASFLRAPAGYFLIGGIQADGIPSKDQEVLLLNTSAPTGLVCVHDIIQEPHLTRLTSFLAVGHAAIYDGHGIVIVGGGATCFSFGSYVNRFQWRIELDPQKSSESGYRVRIDPWIRLQQAKQTQTRASKKNLKRRPRMTPKISDGSAMPPVSSVSQSYIETDSEFQDLVLRGQPTVLCGLDIGSCSERWTPQYLLSKIGPDRKVSIHKSTEDHMSFQPGRKSFVYADCSFSEFIESIENGGREYFRALSEAGHDRPADFHEDFPELAADFVLPPQLDFVSRRKHSSVLRVSGPVSMWLHYDVMANVLCQVYGSKKLILFPPSDVGSLDVPAGSSSSQLNIFQPGTLESLEDVHPHEVNLLPGDVLFIPPLWLHAAAPTEGISVAVNVFFRDLDSGYAAGRDVYGNRDLQAYEGGRKDVARMIKGFKGLPNATAGFYLRRLGKEIADEIARLDDEHVTP